MQHQQAPLLLRIIGWLTVIAGILQVAAGGLSLIFKDDILEDSSRLTSDDVTVFAVAAIVIGVIYILVGNGLRHLNLFALTLGLISSALGVIGGIFWLLDHDATLSGVVGSLILNVIVLCAVISGFNARGRTG